MLPWHQGLQAGYAAVQAVGRSAACMQLWMRCRISQALSLAAGFPWHSPFHGRELPLHINATWGKFDIVDATKALMRAALLDAANAKMVLLSESCIPLYPPSVVYQQLISEPRSRVNACPSKARAPRFLPLPSNPS
jgi:hypothetical protein